MMVEIMTSENCAQLFLTCVNVTNIKVHPSVEYVDQLV